MGIDEIAVERACYGDVVYLRPAERREATARLTDRGYSSAAIAERLRISRRSVHRWRAKLRGAA